MRLGAGLCIYIYIYCGTSIYICIYRDRLYAGDPLYIGGVLYIGGHVYIGAPLYIGQPAYIYIYIYKCHACAGSYRPWGGLRPPLQAPCILDAQNARFCMNRAFCSYTMLTFGCHAKRPAQACGVRSLGRATRVPAINQIYNQMDQITTRWPKLQLVIRMGARIASRI